MMPSISARRLSSKWGFAGETRALSRYAAKVGLAGMMLPAELRMFLRANQVPVPLQEVDGRTHDQDALVITGVDVGVELDQNGHRSPVVASTMMIGAWGQVPVDVRQMIAGVVQPTHLRPGHRVCPPRAVQVQVRDEGHDRTPRREPVLTVPLGRVDRLPRDVAGHLDGQEVDPEAGVGAGVGTGGLEPVAGERKQAVSPVDRVARGADRQDRQRAGGGNGPRGREE